MTELVIKVLVGMAFLFHAACLYDAQKQGRALKASPTKSLRYVQAYEAHRIARKGIFWSLGLGIFWVESLVFFAGRGDPSHVLLWTHWVIDALYVGLLLGLLWFNGDRKPEWHGSIARVATALFLGVFATGGALLWQL